MATHRISFEQGAQAPVDEQIVPRQDQPPALYQEEEPDCSDLITPTMNVVAKVGDLSNLFDAGSVVLDKTTLLVKKDTPLDVVAVRIVKSYNEDTEYGADMGDRANTLAEVRAKGGQIEDRDAANYWVSVARVVFLVKQTDAVNPEAAPLFYQQIGNDNYLLAQIYLRSSAYGSVAKPLFTLKAMQGSVSKLAYQFKVSLTTFNGNTWFRPGLRPAGKPSQEVAEFIANLSI